MEKVSVIIPLYNCEKFLKHTVESVKRQTYPHWEMIIVDDGSTDNSFSEAYQLAQNDSRIKLLHLSENKGVSVARNTALKHASGRYVAFLDSDDLWSKDKLAEQVSFMQKNSAALSHTSFAFMNEDGKTAETGRVRVDKCIDLKDYMKTTQIGISTVMIDRNLISDIHFPEDRELCEDARVWMHLMRKGWKFYGLDKILSLYRVRQGQLSRNKAKMAQNTLKRYWNEKRFPEYKRLYYFLHYACNGIKKRINSQPLDIKSIREAFNCR